MAWSNKLGLEEERPDFFLLMQETPLVRGG
jgi:hypothetical protein